MNRFLALLPLLAAGACSPYDPDLGAAPFHCGDNQACPDGYKCDTTNVCQSTSGASTDGDSSLFDCSKDAVFETQNGTNNNTTATAFETSVPAPRMNVTYTDLVICASNMDVDLYRVDNVTKMTSIKATVKYHPTSEGGVPLDVAILLSGGTTSTNGQPNGTDTVTANVPNAAPANSPYYVRVESPDLMGGNYYDLTIETVIQQ